MPKVDSTFAARFVNSPAWQHNQPLLLITCVYMVMVFVASRWLRLEYQFQPDIYWGNAFKATLGSGALLLAVVSLRKLLRRKSTNSERPATFLIKNLWMDPTAVLNVVIAGLAIPTIESLYSSFKTMIPHLVPFYADPLLLTTDRTLHLGLDPWQITWSLFSDAQATFYINAFYALWFLVLWGFMFHSIFFQKHPMQRMRFLIAFALSWMIIGSLAATVFSSGGPVYYGRITGLEDVFAPLMKNLYAVHAELLTTGSFQRLWSLQIQERLWDLYINNSRGLGSGISAFPSMHIATTALMTFHAWHLNRVLWAGMLLFLCAMQVGSIHLGWHYAVDGYVAILASYGLWRLAKLWSAYGIPYPKNQAEI